MCPLSVLFPPNVAVSDIVPQSKKKKRFGHKVIESGAEFTLYSRRDESSYAALSCKVTEAVTGNSDAHSCGSAAVGCLLWMREHGGNWWELLVGAGDLR